MDREKILSCLIATVLVATVSACSRDHQPIVVGSKNFTEQVLLGEIVAQHLEHRLNEKVVRKPNLGGTLLAHQALVNGEIDLYPEYSGTALTAVFCFAASSRLRLPVEWASRSTARKFRKAAPSLPSFS